MSWVDRLKQKISPGRMGQAEKTRLAEERIDSVIYEVEAEGLIDEDAQEMIHGVLDLASSLVRDVMVPRKEMVAVDVTAPVEQLIETILKSGHSRIPVYKDTIDKIIGLVYAKDLLRYWGAKTLELGKILREPYFIPETKRLDDLFEEFQARRIHLAIVIDEYGGTNGLVSLEDLIEEIVGEIDDEYDAGQKPILETQPGEVVVSARLEIDELFDHFELEEPEGKFATVGGWIFHHTGTIPYQGETMEIDGFHIVIESADERTIKRVRIRRVSEETKES